MILAFYMYSFIQVLLIYMFTYVLLMKLLIIGAFSGKVSRRFLECFGEVSGWFRSGFGQVSERFRDGFGKVSGRFRRGFGEVSIAPPCPAIENVQKSFVFSEPDRIRIPLRPA